MREILFRGKLKGTKEWAFGNLNVTIKGVCIITPDDTPIGKYGQVIPETVGQYTGLTDKNGKKIFEGDIVRFGKNVYQIIFSVGSFALYDEQGEIISKIGGINDHCYSLMNLYVECCWEDEWAYDIEVIGNIHDNPELLKGGDKI